MIKPLFHKHLSTLLLVMLLMVGFSSSAQSSLQSEVPATNTEFAFKLYPTNNMWTFLKLDTRTGRIWQVQYSTDGYEYRMESTLNNIDLTTVAGGEAVNGRYELYPTQNLFNFILLDRVKGATYQVQWSIEPDERGMWLIGVHGVN